MRRLFPHPSAGVVIRLGFLCTVRLEPCGEFFDRESAVSEGAYPDGGVFFAGGECIAVDSKKGVGGDESDALIAVNEGMTGHETGTVKSGEFKEAWGRAGVAEVLQGSVERAFEGMCVAQSIVATKPGQGKAVDGLDGFFAKPVGFAHLASSRRVFR